MSAPTVAANSCSIRCERVWGGKQRCASSLITSKRKATAAALASAENTFTAMGIVVADGAKSAKRRTKSR